MAVRKRIDAGGTEEGQPYDINRGIHVNKETLISMAQYGLPSRIFPLYLLISQHEKIKSFDLPNDLPTLPIAEEVGHFPNIVDTGRWIDSIDCFEDALFAAQIGKLIFSRLPDSYKQKISEVS